MKNKLDKNPIKQRMILFLENIGSNANQFAEKFIALGILGDNTKNYLHSKSGIQSDMLTQISENYPQLNMNWLLTGKGEMLLAQSDNLTENKSNLAKQSEEKDRLFSTKEIKQILNKQKEIMTEEFGKIIMEKMSHIVEGQLELLKMQIESQSKTIKEQNGMIDNVLNKITGVEEKAGEIVKMVERKIG